MAEAERAHCTKIYISDIKEHITADHLSNLLENSADCFVTNVEWSKDHSGAVVEFEKDAEFSKLQSRCLNEGWKMHRYEEDACTKFLLLGPVDKMSDDFLTNFLEVETHVDCDVKIYRGTKKYVVMVEFENSVSMEALAKACAQNLDHKQGYKLEVKPVTRSNAVLVCNPNPATSTSSYEYYFRNVRRNGGSKDAKVLRNEKFLVVYFDSSEVAKRVVEKKHNLEGCELQLELFNLDLNSPPTPGEELATAPSCLNPDDDDDDDVTASDLGSSSHGGVGSKSLTSHSHFDAGKNAQFHDDYDKIDKKLSKCRVTERQSEHVKQKVEDLDTVYLFLLGAFRKLIKFHFSTKVIIEDKDVIIKGDEKNVSKMLELLKTLQLKQKKSLYLAEVAAFFTDWDAISQKLEDQINDGQYYLIARECLVDGQNMEELTIGCADCVGSNLMTFDMFLARYVNRKNIQVDSKAAEYLLETTLWEEFKENDIENTFGHKIEVHTKDYDIFVVGDNDSLQAAAQDVQDLFKNKHTETDTDLKHPKVKDFVAGFVIDSLTREIGEDIDIKLGDNSCKIHISGCKQGVMKAKKILNNVVDGFCSSRVIFYYPGLGHFIATEQQNWDRICSSACSRSRCLGSDIPEVLIKVRTGQETSDWGDLKSTLVHSFASWDQQFFCHIVEGDVQDMKVDAIVVCQADQNAEEMQNKIRQSGQETDARNKSSLPKAEKSTGSPQSTREKIRITQPGYYPCKAVIHVEPSRYFPNSHHTDILMKGVDELLQDILTACDKYHFSSLALPVFGADVPVSGDKKTCAIDVASKALVTCISQIIQRQYHSQGSERSWNRKRKQIFLCSTKEACLQGLSYFFETLLEESVLQYLQPEQSKEIYSFLSCEIPAGNPRNILQKDAVVVCTGKIGNSKDQVLVVPLDLDTDLDLSKSRITQSLLKHGGPVVQSSICKINWGTPSTEDFEKAYAELADQRLLVGKAGYIYNREIYYVYLPPWGPGVKKILCDCLYKCLRRASKNRVRSVAMTALGVEKPFNYPVEFVARTLIVTVTDFMEHEKTSVESVTFFIYHKDRATFEAFYQELNNWKQGNMGNPEGYRARDYPHAGYHGGTTYSSATTIAGSTYANVARRQGARSGGGVHHNNRCTPQTLPPLKYPHNTASSKQCFCIDINSMKLTVKHGDLFFEKCDFIVNPTNQIFDFTRGSISRGLRQRMGETIVKACQAKDNPQKMMRDGVVVTDAAKLSFKGIVHVDFDKFMRSPENILHTCLRKAIRNGNCKVIAFPAIGTGDSAKDHAIRDPTKHLLDNMIKAIRQIEKPKNLKEVRIIVQGSDFDKMANELQEINRKNIMFPEAKAGTQTARSSSASAVGGEIRPALSTPPWQRMASATVKHHSQCSHKDDIVSLYLFSDNYENQQRAKDLIQREIENRLGPRDVRACSCVEKLSQRSIGDGGAGGGAGEDQPPGFFQSCKAYIVKVASTTF